MKKVQQIIRSIGLKHTINKTQYFCFIKSHMEANKQTDAPLIETPNFFDRELVQSTTKDTITFTQLADIKDDHADKEVTIRVRIHSSRVKGNLAFLVLRQSLHTIQAVAFKSNDVSKEMLKFIGGVEKESIVDITGMLKAVEQEIKTCSIKTLELQIKKFIVVNRSANVLPLQLEDASRKIIREGEDERSADGQPIVKLATRLDNRYIDMRTPANQSIFRIQSGVCTLFREYLLQERFIEIHTPKLLGGSSEGGSEVFSFEYFGKKGCLAQSPQLYKQMMIMGDFERVFEIGPVFRAEKSFTHRHLCEFTGLDIEMQIREHYFEILDIIGNVFNHIFKGIETRFAKELEVINEQFAFEPFKYSEKPLILNFEEGIALLSEAGVEQSLFSDLTTETERVLGKLVKEKYNTDFYILHRYPESARPFYTMLCKDDPRFTCSYDVFMRGQEIISGAQRIHIPELLRERAEAKGIPPQTIQDYIDSFKYGAYPHGGFGIGLERVVMLYLDFLDIRQSTAFPRDPTRLNP